MRDVRAGLTVLCASAAFLLLPVRTANASTNVSGQLLSNTTWTLAASPYIVVGDVQVAPGVTLTIEPGVTVQYAGAYQILIYGGSIVANGTASSRITFTSTNPGTSSGARMVYFDAPANLSTSQFSYVTMSDAASAIEIYTSQGTLAVAHA